MRAYHGASIFVSHVCLFFIFYLSLIVEHFENVGHGLISHFFAL